MLQLRTQALPARRRQLFSEQTEVPGPQAADAALRFGAVEAGVIVPDQAFVEIVNPNDFAVDVSGWQVSGRAWSEIMIKPSFVIS